MNDPFIVGLTGGLASGKSTACAALKKLGAAVVDSDLIAREIVRPCRPAYLKIVNEFGSKILDSKLKINRKLLAGIVFADPAKKILLEKITHPAIITEIKNIIKKQKRGGLVVVEAPLLFEAGAESLFDKIVVVNSSRQQQEKRAAGRDKLRPNEIKKRINAQLPLRAKLSRADYIVENSGTLEELKKDVKKLYRGLTNEMKLKYNHGQQAKSRHLK